MTFSDPAFATLVWDRTTHKGKPVNLSGYKEVFRDEFNDMSKITGDNRVLTGVNWYAPGRTDVWGVAKFKKPTNVPSPFKIYAASSTDKRLVITASKLPDGTYQSGHLQGMTSAGVGSGHVQTMGYWEASMLFPKGGVGCWPAFWLIGADLTLPRTEIDIVEGYGGDPDGHHATIHLARTYHPGAYTNLSKINPATGKPWFPRINMFDGTYHSYAVMLDDEALKVYYDGLECARFPMTQYFRVPFYMLISHALFAGEIDRFVSPKSMGIKYVRCLVKA